MVLHSLEILDVGEELCTKIQDIMKYCGDVLNF